MAIQISGCTVIDNSRNITNANNMCVGVVTMTGSSGDIETPGTITAGGLDFPPSVIVFNPADEATDVEINANIILTFDQSIEKATTGIGTTANITLRNSSGIGTVLQTIAVSNAAITISNGSVVTINPPSNLPLSTTVYVVIDNGAFASVNSGNTSSLINTYNFNTRVLALGDAFEGGFLICAAGGTRWIIAPSSAQTATNWYGKAQANTCAQQVTGCSGWFIASPSQFQNPGFTCRTKWDTFSNQYWTNGNGGFINMTNGAISYTFIPAGFPGNCLKTPIYSNRSFRTVSY